MNIDTTLGEDTVQLEIVEPAAVETVTELTQGQIEHEAKIEELKAIAAGTAETKIEDETSEQPTVLVVGPDVANLAYPILNPIEMRDLREGLGLSRAALHAMGDGDGGNGSLKDVNGYRVWATEQPAKADEADVQKWRILLSQILGAWADGKDYEGVSRPMPAVRGRRATKPANDEAEKIAAELEATKIALANAYAALEEINTVKALKEAKAIATKLLESLKATDEAEAEIAEVQES